MAFVAAMNSPDNTKVGVNGANVYTEEGVGDYRVSLFTMLNRGLGESYIREYIYKIINKGNTNEIRDLFVMAFQTRDIRGGKGEKDLFYHFMNALYNRQPIIVKEMVSLIPEYGCWRDMWVIMRNIPSLEQNILEHTYRVFSLDRAKSEGGQKSDMSLLAKWLPREGSGTYPGIARKIANYIYKDIQSARQRIVLYRKEVSSMNKSLKTVEINMCGKEWKHIIPEAVPGRCLKNNKKAFLNQPIKERDNSIHELRYPRSEDRMECRKHFLDFSRKLELGTTKAHGADVVMPHELVEHIYNNNNTNTLTTDELNILQGQWTSIRDKTLESGGLGKCVPMCDFSGSMDGRPKLISLALGILISEINHPAFRDHILTFDHEPKWHSFIGKKTVKEKVDSIGNLGQGLNTNFYKACWKILKKMKENKVPIGEEPSDLIVLTDMGWDDAYGVNVSSYVNGRRKDNDIAQWKTQIQQLQEDFKKVGEEVWGKGNSWKVPRIVIWNLQAKFNDFHAKSEDEGVVVLSGWSPNLLKALQKNGVQVMTPYEGMRTILDDERYEPVRKLYDSIMDRFDNILAQ